MAGNFYNGKDSMDISELASLNEDISDDLIEQLQQKITNDFAAPSETPKKVAVNENDDSTLFEEVKPKENTAEETSASSDVATPEDAQKKTPIEVNKNFDDNFIKKYKAKLQKKAQGGDLSEESGSETPLSPQDVPSNTLKEPIEKVSQGNISEKPITKELKEYNDSLDFLDGNVKYSKYVIYIDPQNVNFIEGLTVKERKNLINKILRQQDDIAITKQRLNVIRHVFIHILVAILIFVASIPIVYYAINASLEATINNHRSAQTNWQTLYKEHGKITKH